MPGPRPTPTKLLKLRGSWRAKTRNGEPEPEVCIPDRPTFLCEIALAEWDAVTHELETMGTAAKVDHATVESYCVVYARWRNAEAALAEQGTVVKSPNGYPILNPNLSVANEALRQMRAFAAELGLSPAARTRIKCSSSVEPDAFENFLAGKIPKRNRKA